MLGVMPLTALPWGVGLALWLAILSAALVGALYVLGVRDVRCYALALLSVPAINGLSWGNATLFLVLLVALAWRLRDRPLPSGLIVGLAIASKLFLWPLVLWLLGTRRYGAAATALATTLVGIFGSWAIIGFDGLKTYPDLLRLAEDIYAVHGYSVATMASALGVATEAATWLALLLGATLAAAAFLIGRTSRDEFSLSMAVVAAILGSPILWEYYYVLIFVPLAILSPRFSTLWLIPAAFYATHLLPRPRLFADELEPGGSACCKPDGVPMASWVFNHAPPGLWPALGHALLAVTIVALAILVARRQEIPDGPARSPS
jgi:hypothetical protein